MLQKTRGIVLHSLKYKDASIIVDIYTETMGRASFLVSIPRSKKANVRASLFQPLALLEFEADIRGNASLHKIKEVKLWHPFTSLPFDPYKNAIALFLSEFLYRAVRDEAENGPLFSFLIHSILWLDECKRGFSNFHVVFLMRLSRFLGLYPNLENYREGYYFDLLNACFVSLPPRHHSYYLSSDEALLVPALMRLRYETMHLFRMNRVQRVRCLSVLNDYYRLHIPGFPELKSLEILTALFD